jgi:hypothetical protein
MRLLELGRVTVEVGPLVLLGVKVPLEPEGVYATEDDETGEADAEADSEEASARLEKGDRARHRPPEAKRAAYMLVLTENIKRGVQRRFFICI